MFCLWFATVCFLTLYIDITMYVTLYEKFMCSFSEMWYKLFTWWVSVSRAFACSKCLFKLDYAFLCIFNFFCSFTSLRMFYTFWMSSFILQSKFSMTKQASKSASREAEVGQSRIRETRQVMSLRGTDRRCRKGRLFGRCRVRTICLSVSMSGERSMTMMEENGNRARWK